MGNESKTRWVTEVDGREKELFSVKQRKDLDLGVHLKLIQIMKNNSDSVKIEQYFSIHQSPKSECNTIGHSIKYADHPEVRMSSYVRPNNGQLLWPICGFRLPKLLDNHFNANIKRNDVIIKTPSYDYTLYSLCGAIFVSTSGIVIPKYILPLNIITTKFSVFSIHYIYGFMPVPSMGHGNCHFPSTSTSLTRSEEKRWPAESITPLSFNRTLSRLFTATSEMTYRQVVEDSKIYKHEDLKALSKNVSCFYPVPDNSISQNL